VELGDAIELYAAFREQSRTCLPSVSAACRKFEEAIGVLVVTASRACDGATPRDFYEAVTNAFSLSQVLATSLISPSVFPAGSLRNAIQMS
jgi:hypothetical protein